MTRAGRSGPALTWRGPFEGISALAVDLPPRASYVVPEADTARVVVVLRGTVTVEGPLAGPAIPGTLIVAPPGMPLRLIAGKGVAWCIIVAFGTAALDRTPEGRVAFDTPRLYAGRSSVELAWRIRAELRHNEAMLPLAIRVLSTGILLGLARYAVREPLSVGAALERARVLLAARLRKPPSLPALARAAGCSRSHFARAFRRAYGCTAADFQRRCRVERAREWLVGTRVPLSELASRLGFADQSHFTRVFRQATTLSPGRFRRLHSEITPVPNGRPF